MLQKEHNMLNGIMVSYGLLMVLNGLFMAFYLLWQNIVLIGLASSFLAVIDPNSFGLVNLNFEKSSYATVASPSKYTFQIILWFPAIMC